MDSIDLIRDNLRKSADLALSKIEEMRDHCFVAPTANGGGHTIWMLGHLAFIEGLVIHEFMLGGANPLNDWKDIFDGDDVSVKKDDYPPFDEVLGRCREMRERTILLLSKMTEQDLDQISANAPQGHESTFGDYRICFQFVADHWYMHRGQLADSRRSSRINRMWF